MNPSTDITRFLDALSKAEHIETLPHGGPRGTAPFVTISRQRAPAATASPKLSSG